MDMNKLNDILEYVFDSNEKEVSAFLDYNDLYAKKNNAEKTIKSWYTYVMLVYGVVSYVIMYFNNKFIVKKEDRRFCVNDELIFVTHASSVVKFRNLDNFFDGKKYKILYLPTIKIFDLARHYNVNCLNANVYYPEVGIKGVKKVFQLKNKIKCIVRYVVDVGVPYNEKLFLKFVLTYMIFDIYFKDSCMNVSRGIWFFDYDKTPHFIPIIKNVKSNNCKTIVLQHGMFFAKNKFYVPPYADYIVCCSMREKLILVESGMKKENIFVCGAPLQAFDGYFGFNRNVEIEYDILVLLANTRDVELVEAQKRILLELKKNDGKVLVRYRPASRKASVKVFDKYIDENMYISNYEMIEDDIARSKSIISFSHDSIYVCLMMERIVHFFCKGKIKKQLLDSSNVFVYSVDQEITRIVDYMAMCDINKRFVFTENDLWNYGSLRISEKIDMYDQCLHKLECVL